MGSNAQFMDGSLLTVIEASKYHEINHIYLEVNPLVHGYDRDGRPDLTPTYCVSDYMKPSFAKVNYLLNASTENWYAYSLIPARRYWKRIFDYKFIKSNILKKTSQEYRSYDYSLADSAIGRYSGRGYYALINIMDEESKDEKFPWESLTNHLDDPDWNEDVQKVIDYCREKNIELTFVTAPMNDNCFVDYDYDEYHNYISALATNSRCEYYDFIMLKDQYFGNSPELYCDYEHLSDAGATKITQILALLDSGELKKEDILFSTYVEKIENQ